MKTITPKYKYLECLSIINNKKKYSEKAVIKAQEFAIEYRKKNPLNEVEKISDDQRQELKDKYPNLY